MRKLLLKLFSTMFILIFFVFVIKWSLNGINYTFDFKNEIDIFSNALYRPFTDIIQSVKALGNYGGILESILDYIKIGFLVMILPFRIGANIVLWLFSY